MPNPLKTLLRSIHYKMPQSIRSAYAPLFWSYLYFQKRNLKTLFKTRLPLNIIDSPSQSFCIAYAGTCTSGQHYWAELVLGEDYRIKPIGTRWIWQIAGMIKKDYPKCHMILFDANAMTTPFLSKRTGFKIPRWVEMSINIGRPINELRKNKKSGFADIKRRIRKNKISYVVKNDMVSFDEFYENMYEPFIKSRFKDSAILNDYDFVKKVYRNSDLYLVQKDNKKIAGTLIEKIDNKVKLRFLGVRNANQEYVRDGAIGALYYFAAVDLKNEGYKLLNVGGTRPVLSHSLTRFKLSLKSEITPHSHMPKDYFWLMCLKDSSPVKDFLLNNPFVYYPVGKNPHRAFFVDKKTFSSEDEFLKSFRSSNCDGLKGTHIFSFCKNDDLPEWIKSQKLKSTTIKAFTA